MNVRPSQVISLVDPGAFAAATEADLTFLHLRTLIAARLGRFHLATSRALQTCRNRQSTICSSDFLSAFTILRLPRCCTLIRAHRVTQGLDIKQQGSAGSSNPCPSTDTTQFAMYGPHGLQGCGAHLQFCTLSGYNGEESEQTSCDSYHDERRIAASMKHGSHYVCSHLPAT